MVSEIGIDSTRRAERPDRVAEGEKIRREPNGRDSNGRKQKQNKHRSPGQKDTGQVPAPPQVDHDDKGVTGGDLGRRMDLEA